MWEMAVSVAQILEPELGLSCLSHWLGGKLLEGDEKVKEQQMDFPS